MQWLTNCGRNKEENYYDQKTNHHQFIHRSGSASGGTVGLSSGLEARPVAMLVQVASQYESEIYVESGRKKVNAKSIMGMMTLGLDAGEEITLSANGEDEEAAMAGIEQYLSNQ